MISPGVSLVIAAYAVGISAPGRILGRSMMSASGGTVLETLMRLMLPIPAISSALSNALRLLPPSACPLVAAAIVIRLVIRAILLAHRSRRKCVVTLPSDAGNASENYA